MPQQRDYGEDCDVMLPYPVQSDSTENAHYTLYLIVYGGWDNVRLTAPGVDD